MFKLFKSKINIFLISIIAIMCFGVGSYVYGVGPFADYLKGNTLSYGKIQARGVGERFMRICYVSATEMRMDAPGTGALCADIAGVDDLGATEGYVQSDAAADYTRFTVQIPENWCDWGAAGDLIPYFDLLEIVTGATIDVRVFKYDAATASTTVIITDTITLLNGAARAFVTLDTLSTGIGADADIGPGDSLYFELTGNGANDDFNLYGFKWVYSIGLQATRDAT